MHKHRYDIMRMKIKISFVAVLILLISGFTDADKFAEGVAAYNAKDYKTAITKFTVLATNGHAHAQLYLAEMYRSGQGVSSDYEAGHQLMLRSAENGNAEAAYRLGQQHDRIFSDDAALKMAISWYERAAEQNHKKSTARLAELYKIETGKLPNKEKYLHWLHKAAEAKHASSMFELARLYNDGNLIEANQEEAVRLVKSAAKYGNGDAQFALSMMYKDGQGVEADSEEAAKWLVYSASNKSTAGLYRLGVAYMKGEGGTTQNIEKGLAAIEEAAKMDFTPAQMTLSEIYGVGYGVEKDLQTALSWAYVAKEKGLQNADEIISAIITEYKIPSSVPHYARKQAKRCLSTNYKWCGSYYPY